MKDLISLINDLSPQENAEARAFIAKRNRRGDVKNLKLFDLISNGSKSNIQEKLYAGIDRNAYHALSKRLKDLLIEFIATKNFETESGEEMRVLKLVLAGRILFEKGQHQLAWRTLGKAESLSLKYDFYTVLHEIYQTQLQYAHLKNESFLQQVSNLSNSNLVRIQNELKLQQAYATLKIKLQTSTYNPIELFHKTLADFDLKLSESFSFKSLFQFMELLTDVAALSGNYYGIANTFEETYKLVTRKENSDKYQFYHFQIQHLLADLKLRNKDFSGCISILNEIDSNIPSNFRKAFAYKLETLLALAHNYSGNFKLAIQISEQHADQSENLKLILVTLYFQQNQLREAYQLHRDFQKSDLFYERKNGILWVVKKELIGLLLLIELDKVDLVLNTISSIQRRLVLKLQAQQKDQIASFLKLINQYYKTPDEATTESFKNRVEDSFNWLGFEREDLFAISFYAWLKSKMENKPLYTTTLELVNPTSYSL